ncbi:MAG: glycoside hydrolase family 97 protein [Phycisphaerales bacterium]
MTSPSGYVSAVFRLSDAEARAGSLCLSVELDEQPLAQFRGIGVQTLETRTNTDGFRVVDVQRSRHDETYAIPVGKTSQARDRYEQARVELVQQNTGFQISLVIRAYDDGIAFRYLIPRQAGHQRITLVDEPVELVLYSPHELTAHVNRFKDFYSAYEAIYEHLSLDAFEKRDLIGMPVLFEKQRGPWFAVTEAALINHAGWYLRPDADTPGVFHGVLSPLPGQSMTKVRAPLPHRSPWRVVMVGRDLSTFIESDLITNLNPPSAIDDPSWIKPGPTTFPWWNGYVVGDDVGFEPGLNTAMMKHYIDFCAKHGIPYHTLDGIDNLAWYGGPILPYQGDDITTGRDGLDFQEVIHYANERGVRLRIWMHWEAADLHMERAFPLYEKWSIEGVMIDFMNRDDQDMVAFYHRLLKLAAKHHLTVTFHGSYKPTGIERTYPHLLNRESIYNLEYNKFRDAGVPPQHELTVPFVRMLGGPLDFHQGGFRGVAPEAYEPSYLAPKNIGTRCHQLATYVVYQNHLPMIADYPAAYEDQPGLDFLTTVPTTWDETRLLHGEITHAVTIARRHGDTWYLGSMNATEPRAWIVPLKFLGPGMFTAEFYRDGPRGIRAPDELVHEQRTVTRGDTLPVELGVAGGQVVIIKPAQSR